MSLRPLTWHILLEEPRPVRTVPPRCENDRVRFHRPVPSNRPVSRPAPRTFYPPGSGVLEQLEHPGVGQDLDRGGGLRLDVVDQCVHDHPPDIGGLLAPGAVGPGPGVAPWKEREENSQRLLSAWDRFCSLGRVVGAPPARVSFLLSKATARVCKTNPKQRGTDFLQN
jgi:hypothetical protein